MTQISTGNHLLDALNGSVGAAIAKKAEKVTLAIRDICYEADKPINDIYFPIDAVISWVQNAGGEKSVEVATVGNEGFLGVPVLLGTDRTPGTSFAQIPGQALKISASDFQDLQVAFRPFSLVLNRYLQALIVQIAQGNACNGSHKIEERCARWLLMTQDRVGKPTFYLTQDFLAQMLGVRRTGVNGAAQSLQDSGIIHYVRGEVTILDRPALEARSCVCYEIVREEFRRMFRDLVN